MTAPLETEYAVRPRGRRAEIDDTLTIAPPPTRRIAGIACLAVRNIESTLTRISRRQLSSDSSSTEPRLPMPTLLSRKSRRPNRSTAVATIIAQSAARVTSASSAIAVPPDASIISTVRLARARSRSTTTTRAPARARRIAAARPLPIPSPAAPPPVTTATLESSPQASGTSSATGLLVPLAMAQLDEEPVRLARVHPGDVLARAVDPHPVAAQLRDRVGDVPALEPDEVDTLAVLREKAADGLGGIGRLHQLDVADPGGQDGVLEPELLGLAAVVDLQPEQPGEARHRLVQVPHDDRQLDDVSQHDSPRC